MYTGEKLQYEGCTLGWKRNGINKIGPFSLNLNGSILANRIHKNKTFLSFLTPFLKVFVLLYKSENCSFLLSCCLYIFIYTSFAIFPKNKRIKVCHNTLSLIYWLNNVQ